MLCIKMSVYRKILLGFTFGLIGYLMTRWLLSQKKESVVVIQEAQFYPEEEPLIKTASSKSKLVNGKNKEDDLQTIEGIGPKIKSVLVEAGINSFAMLATTNEVDVKQILKSGGIRIAQTGTWKQQAELAAKGKWEDLKSLQERIKGGKVVNS